MRIWDVSPGYLNGQSLLGEHRELHGLLAILVHRKRGYWRHPETLRWAACVSGLARRHDRLVAEMRLRGYTDRTPIDTERTQARWPNRFVTLPAVQYALLRSKYRGKDKGRTPPNGRLVNALEHVGPRRRSRNCRRHAHRACITGRADADDARGGLAGS